MSLAVIQRRFYIEHWRGVIDLAFRQIVRLRIGRIHALILLLFAATARVQGETMKYGIGLVFVLLAAPAFAQAPIVVGPSSALAWDNLGVSLATAAGFTVNVTVDALPPKALTGVTCGPGPTTADATCQAPLAQLPTGSHAIALQNVSGGVASLPSVPLVYLDVLIPVPVNTRVKQ